MLNSIQPINKPNGDASPIESRIYKSQNSNSDTNQINSDKKSTENNTVENLITEERKHTNYETNPTKDTSTSNSNTNTTTNEAKNITIPNSITEKKSISESIVKEQKQKSHESITISNTSNISIPYDSTSPNINTRPTDRP